jgi:HAMP domain-containing protein
MTVPLKVAHDAYVTLLGVLLAAFAVVFAIVNLLLHFRRVDSGQKGRGRRHAVSLGDDTTAPYVNPGKDEISSLCVSFNRVRESLKHAMTMGK